MNDVCVRDRKSFEGNMATRYRASLWESRSEIDTEVPHHAPVQCVIVRPGRGGKAHNRATGEKWMRTLGARRKVDVPETGRDCAKNQMSRNGLHPSRTTPLSGRAHGF